MKGDRTEKEVEEVLGQYRKSVLELGGAGTSDDVISMELLDLLIDKIVVYSPEKVEITYSFANELEKWCQELFVY
jgi:hypothetical protein